jgi:hypothetical protein
MLTAKSNTNEHRFWGLDNTPEELRKSIQEGRTNREVAKGRARLTQVHPCFLYLVYFT